MLDPNREDAGLQSINVEFKLNPSQRGMLQAAVQTDWFELIQLLFEDTVRNFTKRLMLTDNVDHGQVLSAHAKAQAALELYQETFKRIAIECDIEKTRRQMMGIGTAKNPLEVESIIEMGIKP